MYIPFESLSDQALIWIYQTDGILNDEQIEAVLQKTNSFLEHWTSHGRTLKASAVIYYRRFLILGVEKVDYNLSCCTVDTAINLLRELKNIFQIDFLQRKFLFFKEGDHVLAIPINQVKKHLAQGAITMDTLIFDHTVTYKENLVSKWLIPVKNSWLVNKLDI